MHYKDIVVRGLFYVAFSNLDYIMLTVGWLIGQWWIWKDVDRGDHDLIKVLSQHLCGGAE